MIIEKLRQSTAEAHQQLDTWLMPVFNSIDSKESYRRILKAFFEYFEPVNEKITGEIDTHYLPDFPQRRKPTLLLDDILILQPDQPLSDIRFAATLPSITNASTAFGALYVLEGSTLGGVFLSKMIAEKLHIGPNDGLGFFYGYGRESREKWNVFCDAIHHFAEKKGNEMDILTAANSTFKLFKQHLESRFLN